MKKGYYGQSEAHSANARGISTKNKVGCGKKDPMRPIKDFPIEDFPFLLNGTIIIKSQEEGEFKDGKFSRKELVMNNIRSEVIYSLAESPELSAKIFKLMPSDYEYSGIGADYPTKKDFIFNYLWANESLQNRITEGINDFAKRHNLEVESDV